MPLFLLIFLGLYGSMHVYFFWKAVAAFQLSQAWRVPLAAWLALAAIAPIVARILDHKGFARSSKFIGRVGYAWMAAVFWFCTAALAIDLWNLAMLLATLTALAAWQLIVPAQPLFLVSASAVLVAVAWGLWEARHLRVRSLTLRIADLPQRLRGLKIVQISDLHLGVDVTAGRLTRTLRLIRQIQPDLVVSTGDLTDSAAEEIPQAVQALAELTAPWGKFAVLGNHEFYLGERQAVAFHQAAGFRLLRAESVPLEGLRLAGVDDPAGLPAGAPCFTNENDALASHPDAAVTILLKHQPRVVPSSVGKFDLQLSGHTHGGQIFPFHFIAYWSYRYRHGRYELPGGGLVYVSRGAGTWGPPMRLGAPPEITLITLEAR